LLLSALWLLVVASPAHAVGAVKAAGQPPPDFQDYVVDLESPDPHRRRLAIRTLRGRIHAELRRSARSGDPLVRDEATLVLDDADHGVAPRCIEDIDQPELTRPCADILAMLETTAALPALRSQLSIGTRAAARHHLERAITVLESYAAEGAP